MFHKILIANRGEIAVRVIRACKELSIKSVAIYSETDKDALHVKLADEAICIGPGNSKDSYLNVVAVLSAAEITDAEAIHPGYGFLAENHAFAEICEKSGFKFIGPSSKTISIMGDKIKARQAAIDAGVPLLPGSKGALKDEKEALKKAQEIGFPVILKASAGGGGRGMKIIHSAASFANAFFATREEAKAAFGNSDMYIEKYLEKPRHIEFQLLADNYGNVVHLFERDCSIQRRNQKVLEEAPATNLSSKLREKMGQAAINLASKVKYSNAGTVEFLVDSNSKFYFMEMNTRVQVEHPVTEYITGIDIVKEQIRIASGEKLRFKQKDIKILGHAIECRINAEDSKNFMPCPGVISDYHHPGGIGVRVDSSVYHNYRIPSIYDSLISKLITFGEDRDEAIARMARALDEYIIEGIKTTIDFHKSVLTNSAFLDGDVDTSFISKYYLKNK
ncbi:acetyl-CoA carboxylase biotin carboxylase subunit [Thermodesulfobacteriota bacterium]